MTFGVNGRNYLPRQAQESSPLLETPSTSSPSDSIHITDTHPLLSSDKVRNGLSCDALSSSGESPRDTSGVNWSGAAFLLVNTALGAGMLNYPYAYDQIGGIWASALIQVILLVFITSTMLILIYCADFNKDDTYHGVLLSMCGKRAQQISAVSITLTCYGICITFLVIIGDQYDRLFKSLLEDPDHWYFDRKFTIFVTAILFIWPMCYAQRLDFLRHASAIGMFAMLYVAFLTVYEHYVLDEDKITTLAEKAEHLNHSQSQNQTNHKQDPGLKSFQFMNSLIVVPILCFAYQTHEIIVPVYACMKERSMSRFMKASVLAMIILYFLYNLVGAYGYATFGSRVGPDIMTLYDAQDPVVIIGVTALVVKFITTYPPLMFCGRGALDGLYCELRGYCTDQIIINGHIRRYTITTIWFITTLVLALFAPDISFTLQLLGSMASINVFVFPGMCLISLTSRLRKRRQYLIFEGDGNLNQTKDYYVISGSYFGSMRKGVNRVDDRTYTATFASLIEFDHQVAASKGFYHGDSLNHMDHSGSPTRPAQRLTCYGSNNSCQLKTDSMQSFMSTGISKTTALMLYCFAACLVSFGCFIFLLEIIKVTEII